MNPDLLLHHQGSLTSLRAIARPDGAAGAAASPWALHPGPPQDAQARGRDKQGHWELKPAITGYFFIFYFFNSFSWLWSCLPQHARLALSIFGSASAPRSPVCGQAAGGVETPPGWQRAAHP